MRSKLWQYVKQVKISNYILYFSPTFGHWKDTKRLNYHADKFYKTGEIPDVPEMTLLSTTPLSATEINEYNYRLQYTGAAQLVLLHDLFSQIGKSSAYRGYSGRSQSNSKLHPLWKIACIQHFMFNEHQYTQFEFHILKQLTD
jgi:hypothetical protein